MHNPELSMTLEEAVNEVYSLLYGIDYPHIPEYDRFYMITRQLNAALRANAREVEWSYYSGVENLGQVFLGDRAMSFSASLRPRIITDDSVRLVDDQGNVRIWAYFLPRDSIHKYASREGLWVAVVRNTLAFSRPIKRTEDGWNVHLPVMREPTLFRLPERPRDSLDPVIPVSQDVLEQLVDFDSPDAIILKAATLIAQSDPMLQPRVQNLQDQYMQIMYALKERDEKFSDSPYLNEFTVPIQADIYGGPRVGHHVAHADERDWWSR